MNTGTSRKPDLIGKQRFWSHSTYLRYTNSFIIIYYYSPEPQVEVKGRTYATVLRRSVAVTVICRVVVCNVLVIIDRI